MKQLAYTILVIMLFTNSQCTKAPAAQEADNPYGLPNATQTGADLFACRINGKNWISDKGIYALGGGIIADTLSVSGSNGDANYFERLSLSIKGNLQEGVTYQLNNQKVNTIWMGTNRSCSGYLNSILNIYSINGNIQLVKLDKVKKILSGTFECTIPFPNCDTLKITDGRFDIRY